MKLPRWLLWLECLGLFILVPTLLALAFSFERSILYTGLWLTVLYCTGMLALSHKVSWRRLWHGNGWTRAQKRQAGLRFVIATALGIGLLLTFAPDQLFNFPRQRPELWFRVMLIYPLLSVIPQELIYRTFFYERYGRLIPEAWPMTIWNAFCFGYMHIVLQNAAAPLISVIGGLIFAYGYHQHRSLKWASIEHAAYGCMIFTIGLGWYFFRGFTPAP